MTDVSCMTWDVGRRMRASDSSLSEELALLRAAEKGAIARRRQPLVHLCSHRTEPGSIIVKVDVGVIRQ